MNAQHKSWKSPIPEPTQPHLTPIQLSSYTKKRKVVVFGVYLRLLSTSAAAATAMMTTAAAIAMYVVVGMPLVGCGATLGEGEVGVCVGADVGAVL